MDIGGHRSTQYLYVTNLGTKDMIIGYTFLYKHNPILNFQTGEMEFTRCPDGCFAGRAKEKLRLDPEIDELDLEEPEGPWESDLDDFGEPDPMDPYINWVDLETPEDYIQAKEIANMFGEDELDEYLGEEDADTS